MYLSQPLADLEANERGVNAYSSISREALAAQPQQPQQPQQPPATGGSASVTRNRVTSRVRPVEPHPEPSKPPQNIEKQGLDILLLLTSISHTPLTPPSKMSFRFLYRRGPSASALTSLTSSLRPIPRQICTTRARLPASRGYGTSHSRKTPPSAALLASIGGAGALVLGAVFWFLVRIPTPRITTHH